MFKALLSLLQEPSVSQSSCQSVSVNSSIKKVLVPILCFNFYHYKIDLDSISISWVGSFSWKTLMWWCDNISVIVLLQILFFMPKLNISRLIFNSCLRKCSTMKWMFVIFHTKSKQLMSFLSLCLFLVFFSCVTSFHLVPSFSMWGVY